MDLPGLLIVVAKCVFMLLFLLSILPILIWAERKGAAYIQDRPGPNRANVLGIRLGGVVHTVADVLKLLFKEDLTPKNVYQPYYKLAPIISMTVALITFAVVPFADTIRVGGLDVVPQVAGLNTGLLYVLAIGSIGVYGIMLAGWSSNNKYALLGGVRSSAQMVSYEIAMGLAVVVMFLFFGSARLDAIVAGQTANPIGWGVASVPGFIAFCMFITASFAETNRLPFDLPEGESELVAGYHVEYSAFKFAMFFMAEYVNMIVAAGIIVTLFFGGYQIPFLSTETILNNAPMVAKGAFFGGAVVMAALALLSLKWKSSTNFGDARDNEPIVLAAVLGLGAIALVGLALVPIYSNPDIASILAALLQVGAFTAKLLFFCWLFIWVRWTLPRFRYDQLMRLGWSYLLPIGIVNLVIAGIYVVFFPDGIL